VLLGEFPAQKGEGAEISTTTGSRNSVNNHLHDATDTQTDESASVAAQGNNLTIQLVALVP
jgi:hypothetical protein